MIVCSIGHARIRQTSYLCLLLFQPRLQVALAQEQTERRLLEKKLLKMKEEITTRVSTFEESVKKTKLELNKGRDDLVKLKVDTQEEVVRVLIQD